MLDSAVLGKALIFRIRMRARAETIAVFRKTAYKESDPGLPPP
jgi:hypothetical protein